MESEEDTGEAGQVWISTRSIIDAGDMHKAYKKLSQHSNLSSMTVEARANPVNDSVSFNFMREKTCEDSSFSWDDDMFSS
jgi:hypothetical protein